MASLSPGVSGTQLEIGDSICSMALLLNVAQDFLACDYITTIMFLQWVLNNLFLATNHTSRYVPSKGLLVR